MALENLINFSYKSDNKGYLSKLNYNNLIKHININ